MRSPATGIHCDRTPASRTMVALAALAVLGCRRAGHRLSGHGSHSLAAALVPAQTRHGPGTARAVRLFASGRAGYDDAGRRVRGQVRSSSDGWGDSESEDGWGAPSPGRGGGGRTSSSSNNRNDFDSWDDFDPWDDSRRQQTPQRRRRDDFDDFGDGDGGDDWGAPRERPRRRRNNDYGGGREDAPRRDRPGRDQRGGRGRGGRGRGDGRGGRGRGRGGRGGKADEASSARSINMNSLERAGFVHLYGLSSVLNALSTGRRDMATSMEKTERPDDPRFDDLDGGWDAFGDDDDDDGGDDFGAPRRSTRREAPVKPEAQFRPYLFVQERNRSSGSDRRGSKASAAQEVLKLAEERGVPIAYVDKGILNVLSGNRPHQGFALRCGKLFFESLSRIPLPTNARGGGDPAATSSPPLWLVLDEVVDPQNLGALLRSAFFLGGKKNKTNIGVLVCSKNSAPPSPVVSASSAGALEVVDVHSTSNLPRTLNQAREDGFRVIGASISVPSRSGDSGGDPPPLYDLQDLPVRDAGGDDRPILLVLGSEGHGLRTLVAKACTEFVCIPSGNPGPVDGGGDTEAGVDSLNVSVSAGIMLWHLLHGGKQ